MSISRGDLKEREVSLKYQSKTAVLVSSRLLRSLGAGQVDFCYVENNQLFILESKASPIGRMAWNPAQRARLLRASRFLSSITGMSVEIFLV